MATKRKLAKIAAPIQQSAKLPNSTRIDESRTSVTVPIPAKPKASKQVETIEISSDSESNYDDISDADDDEVAEEQTAQPVRSQGDGQPAVDGNEDTEMQEEGEESDAEPTFGDLIRNHETVDVATALGGRQSTDASTALTAAPQRQIAPPSTSSIGIVLAQALRTDDADLLESCLHTSDATVIRNTIQRLDSSLAGALLTQLTSRLHRRPGRAHNLMTFVQWTLIGHGGALATQPDIQRRLAELNRVLEERTRGLNSLLALKGKLDMLEAQMTLRRGNKSRRASGKDQDDSDGDDEEEDEEEAGVIYVEDQEDDTTSNGPSRQIGDDEDDDFPVVNGVASDSEDESGDEDEDDMDVDEFAEESVDEDEVDHDDIEEDSAEEDESETEVAPPSKVQKKSRSSFTKKR
ncbi:putative small nucleolar ribonucleoprotein complex component [Diaporthe ampelina]|uniref:Putative small nucleolar ribonucleoprotein complex component n=1 Tax=Diaporthe ampelina TaxID=1214573 RepID=A0A0G2H748_9PEZI|nr:putative small nucleolar ribonucleoprotein complex component [Diaporthe ampelina]